MFGKRDDLSILLLFLLLVLLGGKRDDMGTLLLFLLLAGFDRHK